MAIGQSRLRRDARAAEALARAEAAERRGEGDRALAILLEAVVAQPEAWPLYPPLARRLGPMGFAEASPAVAQAIAQALRAPVLDPQPLAAAAVSALKARHGTDGLSAGALQADPLLLALLERVLIPDPAVEAMLIRARADLLAAIDEAPKPETARFAIALARQTLLNGWMYAEAETEAAAVEALGAGLVGADRFGHAHVVYGLYRPLADLAGAPTLATAAKGPWRAAARVLVEEPLEERRLGAALPSLGYRSDAATDAVKAQYEAFPYPRWTGAARRRPRPIAEVARRLFPAADLPPWPTGRLEVLIAGCGTGKHAADVVSRFARMRLLAIDISRTALGFAARALKDAPDVAFAEADILALAGFERRFDHIESVGVLHHLADPLAGWRTLVDLLEPHGSMRVGFYSKRGRSRIEAARTALRDAGFDGLTDRNLRLARAHALAAPEGDPARLATGELDFYAASGARDFLFHANEFEYRPGELAEMVETLGLRVLGLELTDPGAAARYRARFPDDPTMADLRRWDAVEADAPDVFRHMCQFWVIKK